MLCSTGDPVGNALRDEEKKNRLGTKEMYRGRMSMGWADFAVEYVDLESRSFEGFIYI